MTVIAIMGSQTNMENKVVCCKTIVHLLVSKESLKTTVHVRSINHKIRGVNDVLKNIKTNLTLKIGSVYYPQSLQSLKEQF